MALAGLPLFSCGSENSGGSDPPDSGPGARTPAYIGPVTDPVQGTDAWTLVPAHPRVKADTARPPSLPSALQGLLAEGFAEFSTGPGEPPLVRTPDGAAPPAAAGRPGPQRHRVLRMAHVSDIHVVDDESPARVATIDAPSLVEGAFRPQEGWSCRVVDALVRTLNKVHADGPLDLVLFGGDNVDNAQQNELGWVLSLLDGSPTPLACDSGVPNDPVPGSDNDPKDPFQPVGLDPPWYWVTGNHDVLMQGTLIVNPDTVAVSVGSTAAQGTRDYSQPGAPIVRGQVIPDPARTLLYRPDLIERVLAAHGRSGPVGHGLGAYAQQSSKAFYTFDVPGSPIRFLIVDTAAETGGADGVLHAADVDAFVKPELARAQTDKKWVILASHHAIDAIGDGTGQGLGEKQPDAVLPDDWKALLTGSPNVVLDLVGHAHLHRVQFLGAPQGGWAGFWEVQTGAIADYPNQFRLVEIWDEDNGYLSIHTTTVNYATQNNGVALQGRKLGILDFTSGWAGGGPGEANGRNTVLWLKKPQ